MVDLTIYEPAYEKQKRLCRGRVDALGNPVEMKMSLQQFADIWRQSGKWHLRGRKKGEYCMARHDDIGHYEVGNVKIVTVSENVSEAHKGKPKSEVTKSNMSAAQKGKPKSADHCANMSASRKGKPGKNKGKKIKSPSAETRLKQSAVRKGKPAHNKGKPSPTKGKPKPKTQCPHCGMWVAPANLKRWHGDNCKAAPKL